MAPIYRIELVVDTFYAFMQKDKFDMKLVLIDDKGQTAYSKKVERRSKLGIEDRIYWVNSLTLAQMTAFYKHAQACLMLLKSDGTPIRL